MSRSNSRSPSALGRPISYGTTNNSQDALAYEEFLGESMTCPSCRGLGTIPRGSENEMVALIPLSDKRLKPPRTTCYVTLAIAVCAVLGGLLIFFLFPRSVKLTSDTPTLKPTSLYVNVSEEVMTMTITNVYNVSNSNFYSVVVTDLTVSVLFDLHILVTATNSTKLSIPMRSQRPFYINLTLEFSGEEGYIAHYCGQHARYGHNLLLPFQASAEVEYVGRTEESILNTFQHVRCTSDTATTTSRAVAQPRAAATVVAAPHGLAGLDQDVST